MGDHVWFTEQGKESVSYYYLLALAHLSLGGCSVDRGSLGVDIKEVPYAATDTVYKKLLGLEAGDPVGGKRQYARKIKFGHIADDVWPNDETTQRKRKKPNKKKPVAKKGKTLASVPASDDAQGEKLEELEVCSEGECGSEMSQVSLSSLSSVSGDEAGPPPNEPEGDDPAPAQESAALEGSKPDSSDSSSCEDSDSSESKTSTTTSTTSESVDPSECSTEEGGEEEEVPPPPAPAAPAAPPAPHAKGRDRSFAWGGPPDHPSRAR